MIKRLTNKEVKNLSLDNCVSISRSYSGTKQPKISTHVFYTDIQNETLKQNVVNSLRIHFIINLTILHVLGELV